MKFLATLGAILPCLALVSADFLPDVHNAAPGASNVKERIRPPEGMSAYDVFYAKGQRVYQCNPERTGFQHWYSVQTLGSLYPTKDRQPPFDLAGSEVGSISVAPLNSSVADPMDVIPVIYYYPDGSWVGTSRPLATTTREEGRAERGDAGNLDDHLEPAAFNSEDGYLSHAKYVVRLGSLDGAVPAPEDCDIKGKTVIKPFTAYYLMYTNQEGEELLRTEREEWNRMIEEYRPSDNGLGF
ncbi:hypothetical protein RO3G_10343 [Lichtheimia corymbifera JMRC:FSU:9682]|uniref:Uncharacterized protein n=1 Tax=Lichtheimia corymbifera JMRC:FSU:9682 TaxID=1263082 RepID=A0A068S152_9FUNG|nr:hypothetical protein RO3G_10343 [Lichtheimia corymbifera JMRC:FSU:9682]